jgi:hypothetical protein
VRYRRDRNPAQRAERLIRELGDGAYERATRGEREATDPHTAAYWHRVALVIANRTGRKSADHPRRAVTMCVLVLDARGSFGGKGGAGGQFSGATRNCAAIA